MRILELLWGIDHLLIRLITGASWCYAWNIYWGTLSPSCLANIFTLIAIAIVAAATARSEIFKLLLTLLAKLFQVYLADLLD